MNAWHCRVSLSECTCRRYTSCGRNVTEQSECDWTSGKRIHTCTAQELWVRPSQSMLHTGWSSTHCRSCGDVLDRWKPSFLACATGSPHRRDESPVKGTAGQATKTNDIDRLPCSYLNHFRHWIGKSTSSLLVAIEEVGHVFDCYPPALFELTHDVKHAK